ncbi:unnamed protein product [Rotaria socialis]|uniref:G-protein coupled receptors family 1 profile domain-containing protein n=1 Tax=Rotaria socialis TaxID=392032 RepID=A0A821R2I6_9BILA|nr:unnamed protein product [Rotaria socialis]CAF3542913.1 unnamed protein product [Rotaria socialis]CAF4129574.1 unnamed protein product [Rotaria socialis]CAF4250449.1 unnamed protein product [Rotaria socialis]CAF4501794.1 unnamed protein product [Rotaria socialis]
MSSSSTAQLIINISEHCMIGFGLFILLMGLIGNTLNIIVLNNLRLFRGNPSVFFFTFESICNLAQLLINYPTRIMMDGFAVNYTDMSLIWCKMRAFIVSILTLVPMFTVCCASFDQFLSTHNQANFRQRSTLVLAKYLTFSIVFIVILHGIPFLFLFDLPPSNICATYNAIFSRYYSSVYYPVMQGALPMFVASLFSILAFRNVRRIVRRRIRIVRRRLDRQLTAMVLSRAACLVVLILPFTAYRIYILNITVQPDQLVLSAINNNLLEVVTVTIFYINYSANFYIFVATSSRYRRQVMQVLVKKIWFTFKYQLRFRLRCGNENRIAPEEIQNYDASIELE